MSQRFCRRCLLDEMFEEKEYMHLQDYIKNLDKHIKTEDEEYKKRLDICKGCGCFVEMRAAAKKNY